eukprot:1120131-Alexandrium_andersonii.AAC.1
MGLAKEDEPDLTALTPEELAAEQERKAKEKEEKAAAAKERANQPKARATRILANFGDLFKRLNTALWNAKHDPEYKQHIPSGTLQEYLGLLNKAKEDGAAHRTKLEEAQPVEADLCEAEAFDKATRKHMH